MSSSAQDPPRRRPRAGLHHGKLAERVWTAMFDFLMRTSPERTKSLGRRGLTPNDARALSMLDTSEGRTMRSLAEAWECDASNATWVVNRLEKLGLAERRSVAHDRRVKLVVLTAKGKRTKADLMKEFHAPPAELVALDRADLEALERVLQKLAPSRAGLKPRPSVRRDGPSGPSEPTRPGGTGA